LTTERIKEEQGDRSKVTSLKLFAKVPKGLDILQTECELIFEPTLGLKESPPKIKFWHWKSTS
jgi:hypothetical protein